MAGDWEGPKKEVEPNNILVDFYEAIKPKWPPEGHEAYKLGTCDLDIQVHRCTPECRNWRPVEGRFECLCGAHWTVGQKDREAGIDHIEDHYRYAKKTTTRVD